MRNCEEGHVFNIWIMFGRIRDDVMDIVVPFPPSETQAAQEISNDNSNHRIIHEIMSDAHVSCIMRGKYQLVPEQAKEKAAEAVPAKAEGHETKAE